MLASGDVLPDISVSVTPNQTLALKALPQRGLVLYFYPKDNTPGCIREGEGFRDHYEQFQALGIAIYGVSRDSLESHRQFKATLNLPFELIADTDEALCQHFGVMVEKMIYGKPGRGIERSTFLTDAEGVIRAEWRKVNVDGHIAEVLAACRALSGG